MIKSFITALALALSISTAHASKLKDMALDATVQIEGMGSRCTGSIVMSQKDLPPVKAKATPTTENGIRTLILTAKHCLPVTTGVYKTRFAIYDKNNSIIGYNDMLSTPIALSKTTDLALLQLHDRTTLYPIVRIMPDALSPQIGDNVLAIGYPLGASITITSGFFTGSALVNFPNEKRWIEYYRSSAPIAKGNSGGVLVWDDPLSDNYYYIGVASLSTDEADFINYYVPIDQVRTFLRQNNVPLGGEITP